MKKTIEKIKKSLLYLDNLIKKWSTPKKTEFEKMFENKSIEEIVGMFNWKDAPDELEKENNTRRIGRITFVFFVISLAITQSNYFDFYYLGYILFGIFLLFLLIWLFRRAE